MMYAAKVEDGIVTQVIVGDPAWAADRLGGDWLGTPVKVGVGWQVVDGTIVPPEPDEDSEIRTVPSDRRLPS
jgi:hypothetical protein